MSREPCPGRAERRGRLFGAIEAVHSASVSDANQSYDVAVLGGGPAGAAAAALLAESGARY